jgi:hypothetical protein
MTGMILKSSAKELAMTKAFNGSVPALITPQMLARRDEWVKRVTALVEQVRQWSQQAGWSVIVEHEEVEEKLFGSYEAPAARVQLPKGDLPERAVLVIPIGLQIADGNGRVDLEGYPTLSRVRLVGDERGGWNIWTDSNIPLRQPWNANTFHQLAQDLVA